MLPPKSQQPLNTRHPQALPEQFCSLSDHAQRQMKRSDQKADHLQGLSMTFLWLGGCQRRSQLGVHYAAVVRVSATKHQVD
jgi:hypothetical protein